MMSNQTEATVLEGGYIKYENHLYQHGRLKIAVGSSLKIKKGLEHEVTAQNPDGEEFRMTRVLETNDIRKSLNIWAMLQSKTQNKMALFLGEPGTGKTQVSFYLSHMQPETYRLCAWGGGISKKTLLVELLEKLEGETGLTLNADQALKKLGSLVCNKTIVIDEANHLKVQHFEPFRYLVDECFCNVIFIGTSLTLQTQTQRHGIYLAQIKRRIGSRRLSFKTVGNLDIFKSALSNYFEVDVLTKPILDAFKNNAKDWGTLVELAETVSLVLKNLKDQKLTISLIKDAAKANS